MKLTCFDMPCLSQVKNHRAPNHWQLYLLPLGN